MTIFKPNVLNFKTKSKLNVLNLKVFKPNDILNLKNLNDDQSINHAESPPSDLRKTLLHL